MAVLRRKGNFALGNGELAIGYVELNISEVLGSIADERELRRLQAHVVSTGISALGLRLTGACNTILDHTFGQVGDLVAGHRLLCAVVLFATIMASDGNNHLFGDGVNYKLAVSGLSNNVILGFIDFTNGAFCKVGRGRSRRWCQTH